MKKFFENVFPYIMGILFVGAIFFALGSVIWDAFYRKHYAEITTSDYAEVEEWSKKYPKLKSMATEAIWEDSIINKSEFREIKRMKVQIENEKIMQNITE